MDSKPTVRKEDKMLVSFIIAVYNSVLTIEETILSIIHQSYPNIELIVIDGGSTDGTLDIIHKYKTHINYWISERDRGISDAFNKGIEVAKGDYINFQGAGDMLETNTVIEEVFSSIPLGAQYLISCKVKRVEEVDTNKVLWVSPQPASGIFSPKILLWKMALYHQGLFTPKWFFVKYGLIDENLKFSMDYEQLLRAYNDFPEVRLIDKVVAKWRADGVGLNRELEIYAEYNLIKQKNKIESTWVLICVNFWILLKYYFKSGLALFNLKK